jgi:hypothetical protein
MPLPKPGKSLTQIGIAYHTAQCFFVILPQFYPESMGLAMPELDGCRSLANIPAKHCGEEKVIE